METVSTHWKRCKDVELPPLVPDTGPSVVVDAELVDALATSAHAKGPDGAAVELRLTLWLALQERWRPGRPVAASARTIARSFVGAYLGGMARPGTGERAIEARRAAWVERCCVDAGNGRLRLKRRPDFDDGAKRPRFYCYDAAVVERLVFWASNAALRVFCAMARPMAGAAYHGRDEVVVRSRAGSGRTRQNRHAWCVAVHELRWLGVLADNRPATLRPTVSQGDDGKTVVRLPSRVVKVNSLVTPLRPDRILWASALTRPALQSPEPDSSRLPSADSLGEGEPPAQVREQGEEERTPDSPAEPGRPTAGTVGSRPGGDSGASGERRQRRRSSQVVGQRRGTATIRPGEVRRTLHDLGVRGGRDASERACVSIAKACGSVEVLRRVVAREADTLSRHAVSPVGYLAAVCRGEGVKVRRPDWPGSLATRGVGKGEVVAGKRAAEVRRLADEAAGEATSADELRRVALRVRAAGGWDAGEVAAAVEARADRLDADRRAVDEAARAERREAARWSGVDRADPRWSAAMAAAVATAPPRDWHLGGLGDVAGHVYGRRVAGGWEVVAEPWVCEVSFGAAWGRCLAQALGAPVLCGGTVYQGAR